MAVIDSSEAEGKERNLTSQLDGAERIISDGYGMYQYYLKVVPTIYKPLRGQVDSAHASFSPSAQSVNCARAWPRPLPSSSRAQSREIFQYSVTEHMRHVTPGSGFVHARRVPPKPRLNNLRGGVRAQAWTARRLLLL